MREGLANNFAKFVGSFASHISGADDDSRHLANSPIRQLAEQLQSSGIVQIYIQIKYGGVVEGHRSRWRALQYPCNFVWGMDFDFRD